MEKIHRKPNLYEINHLRLNKAKGSWTWLADVYGLALCLLALSGLPMIWGKQKKSNASFLRLWVFSLPPLLLVQHAIDKIFLTEDPIQLEYINIIAIIERSISI